MNKIVYFNKLNQLSEKINQEDKKIVLVGGCFDIFHIAHLKFLKAAKKAGDLLIVLLESDETVKKIKGPNRPINTQQDRVEMLAALEVVDYVILLRPAMTHVDYDSVIKLLKPAIIATTKNDPLRFHKERQADLMGSRVEDVLDRIPSISTSDLAEKL